MSADRIRREIERARERQNDLLLWGDAFEDEHGNRIDPAAYYLDRSRYRPSIHASGLAVDVNVEGLAAASYRMRVAFEGMAAGLSEVGKRMSVVYRALRDAGYASGGVLPDPEESPRDRALRLRRERNTGPAAPGFRHRGQ